MALSFFSADDMEAHSLVSVREGEGDVLCDDEGEVEAVRRPARMASWSLRGIACHTSSGSRTPVEVLWRCFLYKPLLCGVVRFLLVVTAKTCSELEEILDGVSEMTNTCEFGVLLDPRFCLAASHFSADS